MSTDLEGTEELLFATFLRFFGTPVGGEASEPGDAGLSWSAFVELGGHRIARAPEHEIGPTFMLPSLVAQAAGRGLATMPYPEHAHAFSVLEALGLDDRDLLRDGSAWTVVVRRAGDPVPDLVCGGTIAEAVIVVDETEVAVYDCTGVDAAHVRNLGGLPLARIDLNAARRIFAGEVTAAVARSLSADRAILDASWLVGAAETALDTVVAHVRSRHQFGRPIGSFQALQHRLADCAADLDGAGLLARRAAGLDENDPHRCRLATCAVLLAGSMAENLARETMQMFGGYGVCDEYLAPLLLRRIKVRKVMALRGLRAADCLIYPFAGVPS